KKPGRLRARLRCDLLYSEGLTAAAGAPAAAAAHAAARAAARLCAAAACAAAAAAQAAGVAARAALAADGAGLRLADAQRGKRLFVELTGSPQPFILLKLLQGLLGLRPHLAVRLHIMAFLAQLLLHLANGLLIVLALHAAR